MSELEELRKRVERLESRSEIMELISAYAVACDEHDMPRLESLFTEDACFDTPSGLMVANGRKAIVDMFYKVLGIRGPGYHWTHDHFIRADKTNPDRATGLVLSHAETTPNNRPSLAAMRYDDIYRRQSGKWLFEKRTLNFLYYVPVSEYPNALTSSLRLFSSTGERMKADYPEALPAWQNFEKEKARR